MKMSNNTPLTSLATYNVPHAYGLEFSGHCPMPHADGKCPQVPLPPPELTKPPLIKVTCRIWGSVSKQSVGTILSLTGQLVC